MSERGDRDSETCRQGLVDESLIEWTLALSPEDRLRQNDRMLRTVRLLQQGLATPGSGPDGQGR